jgi:hypothetical protein
MLGGVLGIVLTPVLAYLWATYSDAYGYFGRAYFLVLLGLLLGMAGLNALRRENPEPLRPDEADNERVVIGMTLVGLVVGLLGDVLEYWGGAPGEDFTQVQLTGYGIEMVGLLLVLLGSSLLGLSYRRFNVVPALVAWLLIVAGPGGLLLSVAHVPSGTMLLFCCAWVVLGYLLWKGRVAASSGQHPRAR